MFLLRLCAFRGAPRRGERKIGPAAQAPDPGALLGAEPLVPNRSGNGKHVRNQEPAPVTKIMLVWVGRGILFLAAGPPAMPPPRTVTAGVTVVHVYRARGEAVLLSMKSRTLCVRVHVLASSLLPKTLPLSFPSLLLLLLFYSSSLTLLLFLPSPLRLLFSSSSLISLLLGSPPLLLSLLYFHSFLPLGAGSTQQRPQ